MIVILKKNPNQEQLDKFIEWLKSKDIDIHSSIGSSETILGLVGDTTVLDINLISALDIVETVRRIQEPYKSANRKFHPADTIIKVGDTQIGGDVLTVIAGPCALESRDQIITIAKAVKEAGATMLRGGAFKPRTSPYSFQGMGEVGIELLKEARDITGLPIVTEIMDAANIDMFRDVDVIQVGARNMQNFQLLKELGMIDKPILLKRGQSATYEEWLMSAEYIMAGGNERVALCERGIRTFESYTRNTLDIAAVPVLSKLTHLPIIIDPSHGTGRADLVGPMTLAAVAAGTHGLAIEVHNDPEHAMSDGAQSLKPEAFKDLMNKVTRLRSIL